MEKAMATHSRTLAWKIPWTEEPGRLQSMGSKRVGHDWATSLSLSQCKWCFILNFKFHCLLLVYRKVIGFYIVILYSVTFLYTLIHYRRYFGQYFKHNNPVGNHITWNQRLFYFFLLNKYIFLFPFLTYCISKDFQNNTESCTWS